MSYGYPSPRVVDLGNDLADGQALHELSVYEEGGEHFATLKFKLKSDKAVGHALNPIEETLPDGHPVWGSPTHVLIPSPVQPRLLEALSVPTLHQPQAVEEAEPGDVEETVTAPTRKRAR